MDKRQIIYTTVGIFAFVLGGIFAREKALDGLDTLENSLNRHKPTEPLTETPAE